MNNIGIKTFTRKLVQMLVEGKYKELEAVSNGRHYPEEMIERAVAEYPCTLVMPPSEAFDNLDIVEVDDSHPRIFSVVADLYTIEEGRSDLSLEVTLTENGTTYEVEIEAIHVR